MYYNIPTHPFEYPVAHLFNDACAAALVAYAERNRPFGSWFSSMILRTGQEHGRKTGAFVTPTVPSPLTPKSDTHAVSRAQWLLTLIETGAGERTLSRALYSWARTYEREEPKAIVLGIEIGVLPIGLMGKMKIKREPMNVLVRNDYVRTLFSHTGTNELLRATHHIVEQGLIAAGGTTKRLEPDLGDWFFGDKMLRYSTGKKIVLDHSLIELRTLNAPHACISDSNGTAVVVVTPAITIDYLSTSTELAPLEAM